MADQIGASANPQRSLVLPGLLAASGIVILISLGSWQMNRLAWKEAILARIAERVQAPPTALPEPSQWADLSPEDYEYRRVTLAGTFDHSREVLIFRATGKLTKRPDGPGYHVITPLLLASGQSVLVNRGFIPLEAKDPASRAQGQISGLQTITGLMRSTEERNLFTPADDPAKGLWYTRDPKAIGAALKLDKLAPFVIDAEAMAVPGGLPEGGATQINIQNNHLSYALTWFGLAATLALFFIWFALRQKRKD
jgi:surfeit locus 1 family protein